MKRCGWMRASWLWCGLIAFAALLAASSDSRAADTKRVLWESRDQFVALESQDAVKGATKVPNDHPAEFTQDRLTEIMGSIEVRDDKEGKTEALFTAKTLEILVPYLLDAFRQASPQEDVTFAFIGLHLAARGFAKSPMVTTCRMFYQGGKLNLIVGKAHEEVNERVDRRLYPFTPGRRERTAEGDWSLVPQPAQTGMTRLRKDWLVFDKEWKPASVATPVAAAPVEQKGSAVQAAQPAQPAQPSPIGQMFGGKSSKFAERLTVLNELRQKGLITEEEYRGKRLTILNEL